MAHDSQSKLTIKVITDMLTGQLNLDNYSTETLLGDSGLWQAGV